MIAACPMFLYGDRIDVRSAVGQGTTSRFTLSPATS